MTAKAASMPSRKKASNIFKAAKSFCSFSVNDLQKAKEFYGQTLGLDVTETPEGLDLNTDNNTVFLLNFQVDDIENAIDELASVGVNLEHYNLPDIKTDTRGIFRGPGHQIAWFKDPAGNVLSVIEEQ
jgi:catechol 2,3-dioxygenase-like lactoylglutathione lyase family enzyme